MKVTKLLCLCTLTLALEQPAFAVDNPWFGTWKQNNNTSVLTGSTISVGKIPNGYHFDYGAVKYDLFVDGQDHPTAGNRTANMKSVGKNEWLVVSKVDGKEVFHTTLRLSEDGKKLAEEITGTNADGSTYKQSVTLERVEPDQEFAGTWKETQEISSDQSMMVYSDGGSGKLKVEIPEEKTTIVVSLDGKPVPASGPRAMQGETYAYTKVSDTELKYTVLEKGVPYIEGTETVSSDGKMLKDVSWLVIKPAEKETDIWEKQ